jgi:hypothetical protein
MYLFGITPNRQLEEKVLSEGLFRFRENYTLGCLMAFLDNFPDKSAKIYFDNNYYLNQLNKVINHPRINMVLGRNDQKLLGTLDAPYIVYIDTNITDGFTHLPHFILVTGTTEKMYDVFDPWDGKISKFSKTKIQKGIDLLRDHIKICPFVITPE